MHTRRSSTGSGRVAVGGGIFGQVNAPDLKGRHPVGVAHVVLQVLQRTHQQRAAHGTALDRNRVGQRDVRSISHIAAAIGAAPAARSWNQAGMIFRRRERIVDRVLQAAADQDVTDLFLGLKHGIGALAGQFVPHQRRADMLIADDARHFLAQVGRVANVEPVPGRHTFEQRFAGLAHQPKRGVRQRMCRRFVHHAHLEVEPGQRIAMPAAASPACPGCAPCRWPSCRRSARSAPQDRRPPSPARAAHRHTAASGRRRGGRRWR